MFIDCHCYFMDLVDICHLDPVVSCKCMNIQIQWDIKPYFILLSNLDHS